MDKNIVLAVIFGAAAVVGAMETVYQIYQLTVMDAAARGLKHPKLWGLLAANGNNSSGLLLYLIGRRNYPMNEVAVQVWTDTYEENNKIQYDKNGFPVMPDYTRL